MMKISRRALLLSLPFGAWAGKTLAQGVASRHVKPQPKPRASGRPFDARFTDVAREAGLIAPVIYGSPDRDDYILEATGCGCAFMDYDNDGWIDIFLLTGTRLSGVPPGTTNRLYHNNRDGTFTDVTEKAGLQRIGWASSVCVGDYNNDGFEDLFCTYYGQIVLYRNNGDGTFTDVTKEAGLSFDDPTRWGGGCTFIDYNLDGHLDLFVSNYGRYDIARIPKPGHDANCNWRGVPVECGPRGLPTSQHFFYRNNGDGTFTDVSRESGVAAAHAGYGMTAVCADLDEDGWPDIYVACDSSPSLLFMNNHDGTFREEGLLRGVALNEDGTEQAGMGIGIGDYNLDGHLDLYKTHFADDTNVLYRNDGKGYFDDVTTAARLGVETPHSSRGCAFGDFDNDGDVDILIVNLNEPPSLLRNDVSGSHHWLKIKLVGTKSNRSAIGARVLVQYGKKVQAQTVTSQSSFYSANDPRLHFGLGTETFADVEIRWPTGQIQRLKSIPANQLVTIQEDAGIITSKGWGQSKTKS